MEVCAPSPCKSTQREHHPKHRHCLIRMHLFYGCVVDETSSRFSPNENRILQLSRLNLDSSVQVKSTIDHAPSGHVDVLAANVPAYDVT
ncbi:hypothetical protein TNCV_3093691 [Trichonephila clavipes]|nr:hypothetical protein TNCV_3093691 [Trichonephila clavipes]